jgi:4-hydroxybenzoate polyprenyltransferase
MENTKTRVNWEKLSTWIALMGVFFMFWQSMRDIHKDMIDIRKDLSIVSERITRLEVKMELKDLK